MTINKQLKDRIKSTEKIKMNPEFINYEVLHNQIVIMKALSKLLNEK